MGIPKMADIVFDSQKEPLVDDSVLEDFQEKGFLIVRSLLTEEELKVLKDTVENDEAFQKYAYGRDDGRGRKAKVVLWNKAGTDITGRIASAKKVAGTMEKLLGDEVYHYHSKIIRKDANTGGSHIWHQDYGYWYNNGNIFPDMGTVWIAIDKAHKDNGCMQIIEGSHRMGRIDHVRVGGQNGADRSRMKEILKRQDPKFVEMKPGDAMFFHCNLLHYTDQNNSSDRRWAFLVSYNTKKNDLCLKPHHHAKYEKLHQIENKDVAGGDNIVDATKMEFFKLEEDISVKGLKTFLKTEKENEER